MQQATICMPPVDETQANNSPYVGSSSPTVQSSSELGPTYEY